ncbi:hypothetical protein EN814_18970 [Mesorhizobium sp. M2D.F.Ca.ET.171.01.1.1]|uniref:hypothetical protein n=1 Tax=unclassified Mesorhizobium TaxID=325217 RepID=UPI0010928AC2|nr:MULTISPECIES: hypothetical protein [unclassified Mesorhizobium]TGS94786.1 hypothetical protein EN821_18985 [Mesorhizobium sp. M2D.F.Ca.ET.178.01.1.1]TGT10568.1 hypothetical protein EN814_18970 [Mesorhizobium sp. M2D.F.Ca.ET.171.01.1.1]
MKPLYSIREALSDDRLLGTLLPGKSWDAWRAILIASMGEPLNDEEMALYEARTGRDTLPDGPVEELVCISGRRSGKTTAVGTLSTYLAALCDWSDVLSRGDRGVLPFLAQSQRTAKIAFRHANAAFSDIKALNRLVDNTTAETISLKNGVDLEIRPANFRSIRGITAIAAVADECAFWFSDETSSNPDREILAALRPALITTRGPLIMCSSVYGKKGELWEAYRRNYGADGDPQVLVSFGSSKDFNETLPQKVIDKAVERDPDAAKSEYLSIWRDDIASFVPYERVRACVEAGTYERPFDYSHRYVAFADPSGGVSDSYCVAIGHKEGHRTILDAMREFRAPCDPEDTTRAVCQLLSQYRLTTVFGDKYAAEWVSSAYSRHGVSYRHSELNRSEIYLSALPMLMAGEAVLLDSDRLVQQFTSLERRTGSSGRDIVDHTRNGRDDLANAVAGVLALAEQAGPSREERQRLENLAEERRERLIKSIV